MNSISFTTPDIADLSALGFEKNSLDALVTVPARMSRVLQSLNIDIEIPYSALPGMNGHFHGTLYQIQLESKLILAAEIPQIEDASGYLQNRTFPVRIAQRLGVKAALFLGSGTPLEAGPDIMVVENHINLLGDNPLIGKNLEEFGDRFPDMTGVYSTDIREGLVHLTKNELNLESVTGIVVAHKRPETLSSEERAALRQTGSCCFSSDIVPEAIVARHGKMRIGAVISDNSDEQAIQRIKSVMLTALSKFF